MFSNQSSDLPQFFDFCSGDQTKIKMLGSFSNLKLKLIYPTDDTDPADDKPANDEASEKEEKQNAESIFEELQVDTSETDKKVQAPNFQNI